jgi:hypothetical protein
VGYRARVSRALVRGKEPFAMRRRLLSLSRSDLSFALVGLLVAGACADGSKLLGGGGTPEETGGETGGAEETTEETASGPTGPAGPSTAETTAATGASSGAGGESASSAEASGTTSSGSGGAPTTTSSGSGGSGTCAHDVCSVGDKLTVGCDPCATAVCAQDSYCCDVEWDQLCVDEVAQFCMGITCGSMATSTGTGPATSSGSGGGGPGGPGPGDLVISEIMNNPNAVADTAGEWIEIHNATTAPIDLKGLVLRHQAVASDPNAVHTIAQSVVVPGGGFVVLGINGDANTNGKVKVDYVYPNVVNLANDKDYLAIETAGSPAVLIDEVSYDEKSGLDPKGKSRSLNPMMLDATKNDTDQNFCEAKTLIQGSADYGTPGAMNDGC